MIGKTIASRYRVLDHLGSGGMATVYRVFDDRLKREVALKLLSPKASGNYPIKRFIREFQTVNRLRHPNVIELYDIEELDGGGHFFTMELLDGQTLEDELQDEGCLSPARALEVTRQIALALVQLHETNIIHRDLKPSNIIFARDGRAVLTDFGLALNLDLTGLTETGAIVGTPVFMSPEQLFTGNVDGRSDIYQLGVIFYQMVCGDLPFSLTSLPALITSIKYDEPKALHEVRMSIPEEWSRFVARCLAKDPNDRFRTAQDMVEAVEELSIPEDMDKPTNDVDERKDRTELHQSSLLKTYSLLRQKLSGPVRMGAMLVFTILLLCLLLVFRPQRAYTVQDFKTKVGPESVTLHWRSTHPYPSIVEVTNDKGEKLSTNETVPATTIHEVLVTDLLPGKAYSVVILLPNGRSLPKTVRAEALAAKLLELSMINEKMKIRLHLPQSRQVIGRFGNTTVQGKTDDHITWNLEMKKAEVVRIQIEIELFDGRKKVLTLSKLLANRAKELSHAFGKLTARDFFSAVANDMSREFVGEIDEKDRWLSKPIVTFDGIKAKRIQRQLRAVKHHLKPLQLVKNLKAMKQVAPFVFSEETLSFSERYLLYKRLQEVTRLIVYFRHWDLGYLISPSLLPNQGIFSRGTAPLSGRVERLFIRNSRERPLQLGLCLPAISPPEQIDKWKRTVNVDKNNGLVHTALEFYCRSFSSLALRIYINRKYEFYVCDRPFFAHSSDESLVLLRQDIPVQCWQDGENTVEIQVEWIFDDVTSNSIALERIVLAKKYRQ